MSPAASAGGPPSQAGGRTPAPAIGDVPFRDLDLLPVDLDVDTRSDGTVFLRSRIPLKAHDFNIPRAFARKAELAGDRTALARRGADGAWERLSYAELKRRADAVAAWMLAHPRPGPVLIICGNTPGFAVVMLAAHAAGRAICPVSPTYAALGGEFGRLVHVARKIGPALIFVEDAEACAAALAAIDAGSVRVIAERAGAVGDAVPLAEIERAGPGPEIDASISALRPDQDAALMLTSGSTGLPKVVPITFANLAANTAQGVQALGTSAGWDEVMLDWLPWSHAAGAFVLRATLLEGGSLHIDEGKPAPGLFEASIRNLKEIPVGYYNNVPLGYALLADALEADPELRTRFFSRMRLMLYGGAGLSQSVSDRIQALAVAETGRRIMMTSGYGMTETVSAFMVIHFPSDRVGIGLPAPGAVVKLTPAGERYEIRVAGPQVTRGYLDDPERTAAAFDEDGFYRTGDLAVFVDPSDPRRGLAFAGRAAEEFKLSSGTWVYGGEIRDALMAHLGPLVSDLVLCDDGRPFLTALIWPKAGAARDEIRMRIEACNAGRHGGSARIRRALLVDAPPDANAHEISDKGTLNRRVIIDRRSADIERLYSETPDAGVLEMSA